MTEKPRNTGLADEPEDDLPPIAGDEESGDDDTPLDSLVEEQRDDGMSWLDDRVGIEDYDAEAWADEIGASESTSEPTWTDDSEGDDELAGTEADLGEDAEYGWTEESDAPEAGAFDDGLDLPGEDLPSVLEDGGEEGVEDEDVLIDPDSWMDLDSDDGEGPVDPDDDGIGLGGLSWEQEQRMAGELLPDPIDDSVLKAAWLGPPGAPATALCFGSGQLWAAGAGLFLVEGERLVPAPASGTVEDAVATSIVADPEAPGTLYIGTMLSGLLRSEDDGATTEAINGWTARVQGCGRPSSPSVPVEVRLTRSDRGSVLWLRTGAGHLLRSEDRGASWQVLADRGRVLAIAAEPGGSAFAALAEHGAKLVVLHGDRDGPLAERVVPDAAAAVLRGSPEPHLAVAGPVVLVGAEELAAGTLLSVAPEAPFEVLEACPRATTLCLVPSSPPVLLAALFFAGRDLGTLLRSVDAGARWVRVCDIGRLEGLFEVDEVGIEDVSARIHEVAVNPASPRQVALATGHGVFVVEMKDL